MEITYIADADLAKEFAHEVVDGIRFQQLGDICFVHIQQEMFTLVRDILGFALELEDKNQLTA
jgi:hypothetical protein